MFLSSPNLIKFWYIGLIKKIKVKIKLNLTVKILLYLWWKFCFWIITTAFLVLNQTVFAMFYIFKTDTTHAGVEAP